MPSLPLTGFLFRDRLLDQREPFASHGRRRWREHIRASDDLVVVTRCLGVNLPFAGNTRVTSLIELATMAASIAPCLRAMRIDLATTLRCE